jgi:hypothetical protein
MCARACVRVCVNAPSQPGAGNKQKARNEPQRRGRHGRAGGERRTNLCSRGVLLGGEIEGRPAVCVDLVPGRARRGTAATKGRAAATKRAADEAGAKGAATTRGQQQQRRAAATPSNEGAAAATNHARAHQQVVWVSVRAAHRNILTQSIAAEVDLSTKVLGGLGAGVWRAGAAAFGAEVHPGGCRSPEGVEMASRCQPPALTHSRTRHNTDDRRLT